MNVERPKWSAWTGADPLAGALRSIFQPPNNLPPNLVELLNGVQRREEVIGARRSAGTADRPAQKRPALKGEDGP